MILRGWFASLTGNMVFITRDLYWGMDHDDLTTDESFSVAWFIEIKPNLSSYTCNDKRLKHE